MSENQTTAQKEFRRLMKEAGWTQAETARNINVSRAAVNLILKGKNNPTVALDRLREAVGGKPIPNRDSNGAGEVRGGTDRATNSTGGLPTEERVRDYVKLLLEKAGGRTDRLGWLLMEMKRRLPLSCFDDLD